MLSMLGAGEPCVSSIVSVGWGVLGDALGLSVVMKMASDDYITPKSCLASQCDDNEHISAGTLNICI